MTPDLLRHIHRLCHRAWADHAAQLGLSFSEFEYLSVIHDEEERMRIEDGHGQHLQDIVSVLGVAKASASAMISKLEARGLVGRFQCRQDARAQHIVLTEQGQALMQRGGGLYAQIARNMSSNIKDDLDEL